MKKLAWLTAITCLIGTSTFAQEPVKPRPSPLAVINMRFKDAYVKIIYSQPHKRGREIFGNVVPFGQVWRTGANEATEITLTKDIQINNVLVKAGTYSLFTIPQKDKWTIIINSDVGLWGSYNYNPATDVLRFDVPVVPLDTVCEPFTMIFDQKNELADLLMMWDKTKVVVPFKFVN